MTQITSTAAIGVRFADELPLCMMLQTMAFVVFNKVSQEHLMSAYSEATAGSAQCCVTLTHPISV